MTSTKSENVTAGVSAELAALREDVASLSESLMELLRRQTETTGEKLLDAAESAREGIENTATEARMRAKSASADLEAAIERNPITAILIALFAGLILGLWSRDAR